MASPAHSPSSSHPSKPAQPWTAHRELSIPRKGPLARRLVIYSINDVYELDLLPALKTFIDEHRAASGADDVIVTVNGDFLSPSTLSLFDKGATMVRCLNALGVTHICFGNHEFDIEWEGLAARFRELDATIINTNIHFLNDLSTPVGERCVTAAWRTLPPCPTSVPSTDSTSTDTASSGSADPDAPCTVGSGPLVAILGYLTEETEENMRIVAGSKPLPLRIDPVFDKACADVALLHDGKTIPTPAGTKPAEPPCTCPGADAAATESDARPDYVVALTHQFIPRDRALAAGAAGSIDLILGGHEHDLYVETIVPDDGSYAPRLARALGAINRAAATAAAAAARANRVLPTPGEGAGEDEDDDDDDDALCSSQDGEAADAGTGAGVGLPASGLSNSSALPLSTPALIRHSTACEAEYAVLSASPDAHLPPNAVVIRADVLATAPVSAEAAAADAAAAAAAAASTSALPDPASGVELKRSLSMVAAAALTLSRAPSFPRAAEEPALLLRSRQAAAAAEAEAECHPEVEEEEEEDDEEERSSQHKKEEGAGDLVSPIGGGKSIVLLAPFTSSLTSSPEATAPVLASAPVHALSEPDTDHEHTCSAPAAPAPAATSAAMVSPTVTGVSLVTTPAAAQCPGCQAHGVRAIRRVPDPVAEAAAPPVRVCKGGSDSIYCVINTIDFKPAPCDSPMNLCNNEGVPCCGEAFPFFAQGQGADAERAAAAAEGTGMSIDLINVPSFALPVSPNSSQGSEGSNGDGHAHGHGQHHHHCHTSGKKCPPIVHDLGLGFGPASLMRVPSLPSEAYVAPLAAAAAGLALSPAPGGGGAGHDCRTVRLRNVIAGTETDDAAAVGAAAVGVTHTASVVHAPPRAVCRRHPGSRYVTATTTQVADIVSIFPTLTPDPKLAALVAHGKEIVRAAGERVLLTRPPDAPMLSSRAVREGPNSMAMFLADAVHEAVQSDAVLLPAGKVRGNRDYPEGVIRYIDVLSELPFPDNQVVTVRMSGAELEGVLKYSWEHHVGRGGFLQTDSRLDFDPKQLKLRAVNGKPADLAAEYAVAAPLTQLKGMDGNVKLGDIGAQNGVDSLMVDDLLLLQQIVIKRLTETEEGAGAAAAACVADEGDSPCEAQSPVAPESGIASPEA